MSFNRKGSELATCEDGELKIWATDNFKLKKSVELQIKCSRIDFSPDDEYMIALPLSSNYAAILKASDYSVVNSELKVIPDNLNGK